MSPTLVNFLEDHEFISEEYYLHWYETFLRSQSKGTKLMLKVDNIIPS